MKSLFGAIILILSSALNAPLLAEPLKTSLVPMARPTGFVKSRPDFVTFVRRAEGVIRSLRPVARPANLRVAVASRDTSGLSRALPVSASAGKGRAICGRRTIRGEKLASIPGKLAGCGVKQPVRVSSVAGVALSRPSIMDCQTAKALESWVANGIKPAVGRLGGGVSSLRVIAGYSCRTRNSVPGAKISEHGKGHAIDIAAINLNNGTALDVLKGWGRGAQGNLLRRIHRAACGPFGTVLGPNSDRYHKNHFHLDTARYRGGSYCR